MFVAIIILTIVCVYLVFYCIVQYIAILSVLYFMAEKSIEMSERDMERCRKEVYRGIFEKFFVSK